MTTLRWGRPRLSSSMLPTTSLTAALMKGKIHFPPQDLLIMCTAHAEQAAIKCVEWALATFNQKGK